MLVFHHVLALLPLENGFIGGIVILNDLMHFSADHLLSDR